MGNTVQAALPERRSPFTLLQDHLIAQKLFMAPPNLVTANGLVFDDEQGVAIRTIQNCATTALYYSIGSAVDIAAGNFHGILAGCSTQDDGLGSVVDLSRFKGKIYVQAASGNPRACTVIGYAPESNKNSLS